MRKLLIGAVSASAAVCLSTAAVAQAPEAVLTPTVKGKAGTKKKPKNVAVTFKLTLNKPGTTVEFIDLALPRTLKLSGKGLGRCSLDDLQYEGPTACASAKAGPTGSATASFASGATLDFDVTPFVAGANQLIFYVATQFGQGISLQSPITGTITGKGRKLRIRIPQALRQPGGIDASLTALSQTFSRKKGRRFLVSSSGCTRGRYAFTGKLTFSQRIDMAPVPGPLSTTATAKCSR